MLSEQWNILNQPQRKQLLRAYRHRDVNRDGFIPTSAYDYFPTIAGKALCPRYFTHNITGGVWITAAGVELAEFAITEKLDPQPVFYLLPPADDGKKYIAARSGGSVLITSNPTIVEVMTGMGWQLTDRGRAHWRTVHMEDYYWDAT